MGAGLAEIFGIFLVVVGLGMVVAAAALVSTALAVLAAGLFLVLGGAVTLYVSVAAARKATPGTGRAVGP